MNGFPSHIDPDLIRQYADGELDEDERAALERDVPAAKLAGAVEFEHSLRAAVQRTMSPQAGSAPQALRQRIAEAMLAETDSPQETAPIGRIESGADGDVVVTTRKRRFATMNYVAVAATLAIVAGAVLVGIYGPPIDQWGSQETSISAAAEVSEFASTEHDRCAMNPERRQRKVSYEGKNLCRKSLSSDLNLAGHEIIVFDLESAGYELIGGGRCALPDYEKSAHLMYKREVANGPSAMVSIFIGSPGTNRLQPGQWMQLPQTGGCTHAVFACTDGAVDYLLVCCDAEDMTKLRLAIAGQVVTAASGP